MLDNDKYVLTALLSEFRDVKVPSVEYDKFNTSVSVLINVVTMLLVSPTVTVVVVNRDRLLDVPTSPLVYDIVVDSAEPVMILVCSCDI